MTYFYNDKTKRLNMHFEEVKISHCKWSDFRLVHLSCSQKKHILSKDFEIQDVCISSIYQYAMHEFEKLTIFFPSRKR